MLFLSWRHFQVNRRAPHHWDPPRMNNAGPNSGCWLHDPYKQGEILMPSMTIIQDCRDITSSIIRMWRSNNRTITTNLYHTSNLIFNNCPHDCTLARFFNSQATRRPLLQSPRPQWAPLPRRWWQNPGWQGQGAAVGTGPASDGSIPKDNSFVIHHIWLIWLLLLVISNDTSWAGWRSAISAIQLSNVFSCKNHR